MRQAPIRSAASGQGESLSAVDRASTSVAVPVRLVMLGAPGAGKGTQAERFARQRRVPRISTGDILREAVHHGTDLGREARAIMDQGRLVGDDVVIGIVRDRLERQDVSKGFVLDGFPRSLVQAEALDHLVDDRSPLVIVAIDVPEERLIERLRMRQICGKCGWNAAPGASACDRCGGSFVQRADDNVEIVRERLGVYWRSTEPIVEFYRRRSTFRSVDGDQTPDAVAADIAAAVASVLSRGERGSASAPAAPGEVRPGHADGGASSDAAKNRRSRA
jgi:adenylate kinase